MPKTRIGKGGEDLNLYQHTLLYLVLQFTVSVHQRFLLIIIDETLTLAVL